MKYFLAKTDPKTYSIDNLEKLKIDKWDGVRNPQAVNFLKQMQKGDRVLIYHSQGESAIVGLAEIIRNIGQDSKDPRSWLVEFKFIRKFNPPFVTLDKIKQTGFFDDFRLVYHNRLSTMDVPENFITWLKNQPGVEL